MRSSIRVISAIAVAGVVALALAGWSRIARVTRAAAAIPVFPDSREAGGRTRYLPRVLSWDDRSSARVQRVFALRETTSLVTIARYADAMLAPLGWYLVSPDDLARFTNPQVIVWQRDPDERLDLVQAWPVEGMTRTQRMYGGVFPAEFLDAPMVIEWSWALGGPRSPRRSPTPRPILHAIPPPRPR